MWGLPVSAESASKSTPVPVEMAYSCVAEGTHKDGNSFLGLVNSHSKWIEVAHMTSTSAKSTTDQLRVWFAAYGLPEEVVSDNGP